jgi:hypothetical protein
MLIDSYAIEALDIRDDALSLTDRGLLSFGNNLLANLGKVSPETGKGDDDFGFDEQSWMDQPSHNNTFRVTTALFPTANDLTNPNFMPRVPLKQMNATRPPQSEFFDESANFVGALNPISANSWLDGWTLFPES